MLLHTLLCASHLQLHQDYSLAPHIAVAASYPLEGMSAHHIVANVRTSRRAAADAGTFAKWAEMSASSLQPATCTLDIVCIADMYCLHAYMYAYVHSGCVMCAVWGSVYVHSGCVMCAVWGSVYVHSGCVVCAVWGSVYVHT
jgi:hypothetical protein